jgi:hypothetical protein
LSRLASGYWRGSTVVLMSSAESERLAVTATSGCVGID